MAVWSPAAFGAVMPAAGLWAFARRNCSGAMVRGWGVVSEGISAPRSAFSRRNPRAALGLAFAE
jgi:hypothetical protein